MIKVVFDIECYRDYFLVVFRLPSGAKKAFEMYDGHPLDRDGILNIIERAGVEFITFNGNNYDVPMLSLALSNSEIGVTCDDLKAASDEIIIDELKPWTFAKKYKLNLLEFNHIDIMEPTPGVQVSLKEYAGRMHHKSMQDLPIDPTEFVGPDRRELLKMYCGNDTDVTWSLYKEVEERINLRRTMSEEYGVDLRSKSDAQIAEAVLKAEVERHTGVTPKKVQLRYNSFKYIPPSYIGFRTTMMQQLLETVRSADMIVDENGYVKMPPTIDKLDIVIGGSKYKMGIGGLHSQETSVSHYADEDYLLADWDVTSYYPQLILNMGMYPESMGPGFLETYQNILNTRVAAKKAGDKVKQESLKITLNGCFGKTSSRYSTLYNPAMMIQTTVTGQLSLLMLIEFVESFGISVVSANTDGVVMKCLRSKEQQMIGIVKAWERRTGLTMERANYKSLHCRDVNNYLAIKLDGVIKTKGIFAGTGLQKTPANQICSDAVVRLLKDNVPVERTIYDCTDITKFVTVRKVTGGAVKGDELIGKVIRWYYSTVATGTLNYRKNGNTVARTEGARACMTLPDDFPDDIDHNWYINECNELLMDIGLVERPVVEKIPRKNSKEWKKLLADNKIWVDSKGKSQWQK